MPVSLRPFNTFGIEVLCKDIVPIRSIQELKDFLHTNDAPFQVLGGGSNILLTKDLDVLIIKNEIQGIKIVEDASDHISISVGGGMVWNDLVTWTVNQNLGGLENMALIPGTVGAAPIQNIGAYGSEQKDVFVSLEAVNLDSGMLEVFDNERCNFGYRNSFFKQEGKGKYFITSVTYRLSKAPIINKSYKDISQYEEIHGTVIKSVAEMAEAVSQIRRAKLPDPQIVGNAGSFFKNPIIPFGLFESLKTQFPNLPFYSTENINEVKIPAGWLIDQAGLKGLVFGNTGTHPNQALVIVNNNNATGKEILECSLFIQEKVFDKYGVSLEAEVNIW